MMKYNLIATMFIAFTISALQLNGQNLTLEECGTGDSPEHISKWLQSIDHDAIRFENNDTTWMAAQLFLIHHPNGNVGILIDSLMSTMRVLNRRFAPAKMQFYLAGPPKFIPNADWASPPSKQMFEDVIDSFNIARVVNIYFTNLGSQGLCGYAYYPNSGPGQTVRRGAAVMSYSCSQPNSGTLAHELGHFFSLPHPFQGTSGNPQSPTAERVTRDFQEVQPRLAANCNSTGDFFCDTPADPYGARWQCISNPATFDINGDRFFADSTLVMSYAANNCRDIFSQQQMNAMNLTIASQSASRGYLTVFPKPTPDAITALPTPTIPADGETGLHPNFIHLHWTAVSGAEWYHVTIRRSSLPNILTFDTLVSATSMSIYNNKLLSNTSYQWAVRPANRVDYMPKAFNWQTFTTGQPTAASLREYQADELAFYPNPVGQQDVLKLLNPIQESTTVVVSNLQGQTVLQFDLAPGTHHLALESRLSAGTYIFRMMSRHKQQTQRIVVMP
ncbi:MAG: zinc-dependent metalloprotease [Bacteroidia bacterium]